MHRTLALFLSLSFSLALFASGPLRVSANRVGKAPVIDGKVNPVEWKGATHVPLSEGQGEALLLHDGNYLYIGIIGFRPGLGSVCLPNRNGIVVLHASAALGTAAFEQTDGKWRLTHPFKWTNRDTGMSPEAMAEREKFLTDKGWFANTSPNALLMREYQVPIRGKQEVPLTIAFYTFTPEKQILGYWPPDLEDDCADPELAGGSTKREFMFDPSKWGVVVLKGEPPPTAPLR
ncbi:MAG: hypothetical protein ACJ74H_04215 [Thermoanaerobaculia bacterium]